MEDLWKVGMESDTISSVQVPRGYTAILYKDDGFVNEIHRIHGWYENELTQELGCYNLRDTDINDQVTSVRIVKDMIAVGYWQAITSTET